MFKKMYQVQFVISVYILNVVCSLEGIEIRNLIGEPDYRQVRLYWETFASTSTAPKNDYIIRYCELQNWLGSEQRCRIEQINNDNLTDQQGNFIDGDELMERHSINIKGLRMATSYSFEIKDKNDQDREDRAEDDVRKRNMIILPTKGFSAKATQCLPHATEIEVSTGPYFGGRIAVEGKSQRNASSNDDSPIRCAIVDGDSTSLKDTYLLRINHTECGNRINETTVSMFVLVQENLPILTHSTRRFLVLCSHQPETLTVRAGINLPTHHQQRAQVQLAATTYEDDNQSVGRRSRHMKLDTGIKEARALVNEDSQTTYKSQILSIFVVTMLSIAAVIGLIAIILKVSRKQWFDDLDNVSVISDLSSTVSNSCSIVAVLGDSHDTKFVKT